MTAKVVQIKYFKFPWFSVINVTSVLILFKFLHYIAIFRYSCVFSISFLRYKQSVKDGLSVGHLLTMLHICSQTLNGTTTMELLTCKDCVKKKRIVSSKLEGSSYTPVVLRRCTRPCCNHRPRLVLENELVSLCSVLEISTMPRIGRESHRRRKQDPKVSPRHLSAVGL